MLHSSIMDVIYGTYDLCSNILQALNPNVPVDHLGPNQRFSSLPLPHAIFIAPKSKSSPKLAGEWSRDA